MEHPLISNLDDLNLEQLQERITELTRKVGIAHRMGNAQLRHQVQMALETYQNKYQQRQKELWDQKTADGNDFSDRIDVS
jgi:phage-related tail protein